jgi:hydroxyacylglutathione hydrolase
MKIDTVAVGPLQVNCFIVYDEDSHDAIVVDPGDEAERIIGLIEEKKLKVSRIVCTHAHFDHVGAVKRIKDKTGAAVLLHKGDSDIYMRVDKQGALWGFHIEQPPVPDLYVIEGDEVDIGRSRLTILHTPGHSPGGICLYGEGVILTGDTIFAGSVGRTDFPGGSLKELKSSFARIIALPPETMIFPGHGPLTSVKDEKEGNFFVYEL